MARSCALPVALLALALTLLAGSAGADVGSYTGTLYMSDTASSTLGSGRQLVTSAPSGSSTATNRISSPSPNYFLAPVPACGATTCGYQEFAPGVSFTNTTTTISPIVSLTPNGNGWIVDGAGGVTFASGSWTFRATTKLNGGSCVGFSPPCTAHLVVGMWKVTTGPFATVQTLVDPSSAGENGTNIATTTGTLTISHTVSSVAAFSLGWNEHLYVQFWRRQVSPMNGGNANRWAALFYNDGTAAITAHPTPDGWPSAAVSSPAGGLRTNAIPQLSASYSDPEGTAGTVSFQLCSDSSCTGVLQSGSATSVASGSTGSWTPTGPLGDGVYYWRAQTQDGGGNNSGWTSTRSFTLDRVAPTAALDSPANAALTNSPVLSATFNDADAGDSGTVDFRVCSDSACGSVLSSGSVSSVSNGATATWTINPSVSDGVRYWQARSTDVAGNASAWSSSRSFTLDTTPPDTTISSSPATPTKVTSASFAFGSTETGSTFACSLDGAAFSACTSPQAYAGPLADGSHTFEVKATDAAGNTDPSPASFTWTVDTVAPDTSIGPGEPAALSNSSAASFDLASTETGSTFECSRDGGAFSTCASPKSYSGLADGSHTFEVRATDAAGNTDTTPASYTWTIDTTPPQTTLDSTAPAAATDVTSATFLFSSEASATFSCSFDGSAFAACASPQSFAGLADGSHTLQVKATDAAGNDDPTPVSVTWRVDTAAPVTTIDTYPGKRSNESRPSFGFSANEPVTRFECSVDGSAFSSCASPYRTGSLADGKHTFRVRAAADTAGNAGVAVEFDWTIDTTPPSTPSLGLPEDRVTLPASPLLTATYRNPDATDVGTVEFRVCTRAAAAGSACSGPVGDGTSFITALDGHDVDWHPDVPFGEGVYYWQARGADDVGNKSAWTATRRFTVDTSAPVLASSSPADGARVNRLPKLTATFTDVTPDDRGTVDFQLCTDDTCASVLAAGSAELDSWSGTARFSGPELLRDGTYFWRVRATDAVGNSSGWSKSLRLVLETTAPQLPTLAAPDEGASLRTPTLSAGFLDPDIDDVGTVLFRICADPGCRLVVAAGASEQVGNGETGTWSGPRLHERSYFWQAAARDAAGNTSDWTTARRFKLDRTKPRMPRSFKGTVSGGDLMLTWRAPAGGRIASYRVFVGGETQDVAATAHSFDVGAFDENDTRTFAVAAVDEAGNVSMRTRVLVGVPNVVGMTAKKASSVLRSRGLVLGWRMRQLFSRQAVVIAQRPAVPAVAPVGSAITVVTVDRMVLGARRR